jgi:hypothetical protein
MHVLGIDDRRATKDYIGFYHEISTSCNTIMTKQMNVVGSWLINKDFCGK